MKKLAYLVCLVIISHPGWSQDWESITPKPVSVKKGKGRGYEINEKSVIYYYPQWSGQAGYLQKELNEQVKLQLRVSPDRGITEPGIFLKHDSLSIDKPEMYRLEVSGSGITIRARDIRGVVNGMQTLLQLLPLNGGPKMILPGTIEDYPAYGYRGMHLDVVRHFFPVEYIKNYIDYLSFHKFNTFHWHLTDDQGWRIEMLSYKKLNEIGSWRNATLIGHFRDQPARYDSTRYGGYYTRAEMKEVIDYAAVRGINIIPEIDIPGHSRSIIAAYPEFSTRPDTTWNVATTWGMYNRQNNVLAPRPETFAFLRTVFHEIAELFPSEYIHLGGDECSKIWWKADPVTQRFMKENGLKDEAALQTYFIRKVSEYLAEKNKKTIGWHEIMEGSLDRSTVVMNWANEKTAIEAATKGYSVIMTPGKPLYFDHYQTEKPGDSLAIHGYNPTAAVYAFDPVPAAIKKAGLEKKILGAQANVWTEYIAYPSKVDYMVFPRMTALSEALWTPPSKKDYKDFRRRLHKYIIPRYEYWGSSYFGG